MRVRNEQGAVAVEFALLAPLIVVILFATIEFGIAMSRALAYASAAREGARYAAVSCRPDATTGCTTTLIRARIVSSMPAGYPVDFGTGPTVSQDCATMAGNPIVTVSWTQNVPIDVPFLPDLSWTIHPTGAFRCE
jgi:Flp pilus assembly protein TadG